MKPSLRLAVCRVGVFPWILTLSATVPLAASTWTGAVDEDWLQAGNWSSNKVPSGVMTEIGFGNVVLSGGAAPAVPEFSLGGTGNPELTIRSGGQLRSGTTTLAGSSGSSGRVTVTGVSGTGNRSSWTSGGLMYLGGMGTGTVEVTDGGLLGCENLNLGRGGSLLISGMNSDGTRSTFATSATINYQSSNLYGDVKILNGALFSSDSITVQNGASVLVSGTNGYFGMPSLLDARQSLLTVAGKLEVTGGAEVNSKRGEISNGEVLVSGASKNGWRSAWYNEDLDLDRSGGNSTLRIENGGLVTSDSLSCGLGGGASSRTTILVDGISDGGRVSTLMVGRARLGSGKAGTDVTISDGGRILVMSGNYDMEGSSTTEVSGIHSSGMQSMLSVSGALNVWTGSLAILDGGLVECASLGMGFRGNHSGISVDGVGKNGVRSTLDCNGTIGLGTREYSNLDVSNGGHVISQSVGSGTGGTHEIHLASRGILETGFISGSEIAPGGLKLIFNGGILRFSESGEGIRNLDPDGTTILSGGATFDTGGNHNLVGAVIGGEGGLTKIGYGSLELTGENTFAGDTLVKQGTLILNNVSGSATGSGNVVVGQDATLAGGGGIAGNLTNLGFVSPGNSPGTLRIGGNFIHRGELDIEVAPDGSHDQVLVGGDVDLRGSLSVSTGGMQLEYGKEIEFILARGKIRNRINTLILDGVMDGRTNVVTGDGVASFVVAPDLYSEMAASNNEKSLAAVLDSWIEPVMGYADGDIGQVSQSLDLLTAEEYPAAFAAISPVSYEAVLNACVDQSQNQSSSIHQYLDSRRIANLPPTRSVDLWSIATGRFSSDSQAENSSGGGLVMGTDMWINPFCRLGFFTGFGDSETKSPGMFTGDVTRMNLGVFVTAENGGFHMNSAIGGGRADMDMDRSIRFGNLSRTARSDGSGSELFSWISGGYDLRAETWRFGPMGSLQYSRLRFEDVEEHGAGALGLGFNGLSNDSLRGRIGVRVANLLTVNDQWVLIPEFRTHWQHEFLPAMDDFKVSLEEGSGGSFVHETTGVEEDSLVSGFSVGFQTSFGIYGNLSFDVEIGKEVNHSVSAGVEWTF